MALPRNHPPLVDVFDAVPSRAAMATRAPKRCPLPRWRVRSPAAAPGATVQITSSYGVAPRRGWATTSASHNTFVYTDYSPATNGACRLGLAPPPGPLGNGYGTCAASICVMPLFLQLVNEAAWFLCPGLRCTQDNARTTTLLSPTHTPVPLFPAADECNATHILDGTIPFAPT